MENNQDTISQTLKEEFFKGESTLFSKKSKKVHHNIKSSTEILSNITNQKRFTTVKSRYKLKLILSKILLKSHLEWILYAFYTKNTLYIGTQNHIGQSELNMQKDAIIHNIRKLYEYKDIEKVSIIRDKHFTKLEKFVHKNEKIQEKSYGIFENNFTDKKLHNIVENIRNIIKHNN
jgi:hypothetical protein